MPFGDEERISESGGWASYTQTPGSTAAPKCLEKETDGGEGETLREVEAGYCWS